MDFPLVDLLDEDACYDFLVGAFHPHGLSGPTCSSRRLTVRRAPVMDCRCACGRGFNAWTGNALKGTQRRPTALLLIVVSVRPTAFLTGMV